MYVVLKMAISRTVLTKIARAVIALKCSFSFAFLLAQSYRVLKSCGDTNIEKINVVHLEVQSPTDNSSAV